MRRQYFVDYYMDFGNTYNLLYADTEEELKLIPKNAERITRKAAEELARCERNRRTTDGSFSGFADSCIFPVAHKDECDRNNRKWTLKGCIWEREYDHNYRVVNRETGEEVSEAFDDYETAWQAHYNIAFHDGCQWQKYFIRSQIVD